MISRTVRMWRHKHPDWSAAVVLLIATVCLILDRSMAVGVIPTFPPWNLRYLPAHTLAYHLIVPGVTLVLLGYNPLSYLWIGRWRAVMRLFLSGLVLMLVLAGGLLTLPSARAYYATGAGVDSVTGIFFTMLATEYFSRGFLLLPLFERFGWIAACIAVLPYGLAHVGKPLPEALGSIPYALALSYLAIRSGSVMYGVVLHCVLAYGVTVWIAALR